MEEALSQPGGSLSQVVHFDFWMLPNRDLQESFQKPISREDNELKSGAQSVEWPYSDVGLGTLLIRDVAAATKTSICPSAQDELIHLNRQLKWKTLTFEKHNKERLLRIQVENNFLAQCYFLKIEFIFQPRIGDGNFAIQPDGSGHLSGPIFPLWKTAQVRTRIRFNSSPTGPTLECTGCKRDGARNVVVDFVGLPPALYFIGKSKSKSRLIAVSLSKQPEDGSSEDFGDDGEINETISMFLDFSRRAIEKLQGEKDRKWQTSIRTYVLLEKLVAEQIGEIQLHASFGKVNPLLSVYHRAALFRALARDFMRFALSLESNNINWTEAKDNEFITRLVAELWLIKAFPSINKLRDISDDFSFLPFFRAIQQGTAFLNNAVFVGSEERPGQIDFHLFHEFYAPLTGDKILERIRKCTSLETVKSLELLLHDVVEGKKYISEIKTFMTGTPVVSECGTPVRLGLIFETLPEEQVEINSAASQLILKRKILPNPPSFDFLFTIPRTQREPINLDISKRGGLSQILHLKAADNEESIVQLPSDAHTLQVLEPNRAVSHERLRWPRPLRTVLQALALNYDSRRTDLTMRSQLQVTQSGDEWGRALLLGFRRELSKNNVDLQFLTQTPSIIPGTRASLTLGSNVRFEKSPPTFVAVSYGLERGGGSLLYPDGAGVKLWLRRPLSLSALKEKMADPYQEWIFSYASGLAPRLTWSETIAYGASDSGVDVGLRSVPGWPAEEFVSREYAFVRSELRQTVTQNFNASLAKSILFQHAVLYSAHVFAFDRLQTERQVSLDARVAQSLVFGVRFFGALFGAKDQAISLELSRAMTSSARTSFGFSLGKAMN